MRERDRCSAGRFAHEQEVSVIVLRPRMDWLKLKNGETDGECFTNLMNTGVRLSWVAENPFEHTEKATVLQDCTYIPAKRHYATLSQDYIKDICLSLQRCHEWNLLEISFILNQASFKL